MLNILFCSKTLYVKPYFISVFLHVSWVGYKKIPQNFSKAKSLRIWPACLQRGSIRWSESGGYVAWVWITTLRWWNLGLPVEWLHIWLAGSWGIRGRWRDSWGGEGPYPGASRQAQHTRTHTYTGPFSSPSSVSLSPSSPALNMFTFNRDLMCRLWKTRGQKNTTALKQLMWKWQGGSPRCPRQRDETHTGRHLETWKAFITLIWNVSCLSWAVFVFCHRGCHTHPLCAVTTARRDRQIQVPHKHILRNMELALTWLCSHTQAANNHNSSADRGRGLVTSLLVELH